MRTLLLPLQPRFIVYTAVLLVSALLLFDEIEVPSIYIVVLLILFGALALIGTLVFIMIVELLNTAIEKLSDRVSREQDPALKRVKDMGSAAILLSLLLAGALWLWVAIERFWPA